MTENKFLAWDKKITEGVMVVKDRKGWGIVYEDGRSEEYGWIPMFDAPIHEYEFCEKTTDVTYKGSHHEKELETGELVNVRKTVTIEILKEKND